MKPSQGLRIKTKHCAITFMIQPLTAYLTFSSASPWCPLLWPRWPRSVLQALGAHWHLWAFALAVPTTRKTLSSQKFTRLAPRYHPVCLNWFLEAPFQYLPAYSHALFFLVLSALFCHFSIILLLYCVLHNLLLYHAYYYFLNEWRKDW